MVYRIQRDGKRRMCVVVHFNRLKLCVLRQQSQVKKSLERKVDKKTVGIQKKKGNVKEVKQASDDYDSDEHVWIVSRDRPKIEEVTYPKRHQCPPNNPEYLPLLKNPKSTQPPH